MRNIANVSRAGASYISFASAIRLRDFFVFRTEGFLSRGGTQSESFNQAAAAVGLVES
jgi:hypothetical protein